MKRFLNFFCIVTAVFISRFLFLGKQSFGLDESFSYWVALHSLFRIVNILHYDAHPPLFYMFLHFWEMGGSSAAYLRIPFALCGVINIVMLYFLGEEFLGKGKGYFTGGLWAVSFYALEYESWCRMYALALTLSLLATWFFWQAFKRPSIKAWAKYFIFAVLSIYTHYYTAFILLAHWIFLLFYKRWKEALWGLAVTALAYLPWFPVFFFQIAHKVSQTFPSPSITTPFMILTEAFATTHFFLQRYWYFILGSLSLLVWLIGIGLWLKSEKEKSIFCALLFSIPFLLPLVVTVATPLHIYSARYAIIFLPYLFFPIVKGLSKLPFSIWVPLLSFSLAINLFVSSLYFTSPVYQKQNFKLASQKIQESLKPGDFLLVEQLPSLFPLAYYLPEDLKIRWRENMYIDPVDPGYSHLTWYGVSGAPPIPLVRKITADSRRIWLIMCQYQTYDPDKMIYAYLGEHDQLVQSYKIRDLGKFESIEIFLFRKRDLK